MSERTEVKIVCDWCSESTDDLAAYIEVGNRHVCEKCACQIMRARGAVKWESGTTVVTRGDCELPGLRPLRKYNVIECVDCHVVVFDPDNLTVHGIYRGSDFDLFDWGGRV